MSNKKPTINETIEFEKRITILEENIRLFRERLKNGTSNPSDFLNITQIEKMWSDLSKSTQLMYSDMVRDILASADEKAIIKEKKTSTNEKESN